jgi:hypothetical protein
VAPILIKDSGFQIGAFGDIFLALGLPPPAHAHSHCQAVPVVLVQRPQREGVLLAFGNGLILIVLHFINNNYENRPSTSGLSRFSPF